MAVAMVLAAADLDWDIDGDEKFCFYMYGRVAIAVG